MNIVKDYIPTGRANRPGKKITPRYITIHETDNTKKGAGAKNHADYLKGNDAASRPVSWHFTVDDKEIIQHLPTNEMGYHAGDGRNGPGNTQSIAIEICVNSDGDFEKAVQNAVWLVKKLMAEHNIPINRVVPHKHWTGKNCPRLLLPRWSEFLNLVEGGGPGNVEVTQPNVWTGQVLKRGDKGLAVRDLQVMLQAAGFDPGQPDGIFGQRTEQAVRAAQKELGLVVDGVAGPKTFEKLKEVMTKPKTITHDGKRFRVVTGTFANRQDAEVAARKIRETFGYLTNVIDA